MEYIPVIASVTDLEDAVEYASRVESARWFVERAAKRYGKTIDWDNAALVASAADVECGQLCPETDSEIGMELTSDQPLLSVLQEFVHENSSVEDVIHSVQTREHLTTAMVASARLSEEGLISDEQFEQLAFELGNLGTELDALDNIEDADRDAPMTAAARYVRTPAGAKRFKQPIGSKIFKKVYIRKGSTLAGGLKVGDVFEARGKKYQVDSAPEKFRRPGADKDLVAFTGFDPEDPDKPAIRFTSDPAKPLDVFDAVDEDSPEATKKATLPGKSTETPEGKIEVKSSPEFLKRRRKELLKEIADDEKDGYDTNDAQSDLNVIESQMRDQGLLPRKPIRQAIKDAGFKWNSVYQKYEREDGWSLQSVAGGEWRSFPPGVSLWSTSPKGVGKHATLDEAFAAASKSSVGDTSSVDTPKPSDFDDQVKRFDALAWDAYDPPDEYFEFETDELRDRAQRILENPRNAKSVKGISVDAAFEALKKQRDAAVSKRNSEQAEMRKAPRADISSLSKGDEVYAILPSHGNQKTLVKQKVVKRGLDKDGQWVFIEQPGGGLAGMKMRESDFDKYDVRKPGAAPAAKAAPTAVKPVPAAPAAPATASPTAGGHEFSDAGHKSLGVVDHSAKGKDPERFIPKSTYGDGTTPAIGQRVYDKDGNEGTVAQTYQLYTGVKFDNGKVKSVRNDKLNVMPDASAPKPSADKAAPTAAPASRKFVFPSKDMISWGQQAQKLLDEVAPDDGYNTDDGWKTIPGRHKNKITDLMRDLGRAESDEARNKLLDDFRKSGAYNELQTQVARPAGRTNAQASKNGAAAQQFLRELGQYSKRPEPAAARPTMPPRATPTGAASGRATPPTTKGKYAIARLPVGTDVRISTSRGDVYRKVGSPVVNDDGSVVGRYRDVAGQWDYVQPDTEFDVQWIPPGKDVPKAMRAFDNNGKPLGAAPSPARPTMPASRVTARPVTPPPSDEVRMTSAEANAEVRAMVDDANVKRAADGYDPIPTGPGFRLFEHPQGKTVKIYDDGRMEVTKNGKPATTSGGVDKFLSGKHGAWKLTQNKSALKAEDVPRTGGTATPAASRPTMPPRATPTGPSLGEVTAAMNAYEAAFTKADATPSGPGRMAAFNALEPLRDKRDQLTRELEAAGRGHELPDSKPTGYQRGGQQNGTLRVANMAQKILLEEELMGQISDGMWENSGGEAWQSWTSANVIVDPRNLGRNFGTDKDNYLLTSKELRDAVGDRMLEEVRKFEPTYTEQQMLIDLRELRKIFKMKRPVHPGKA